MSFCWTDLTSGLTWQNPPADSGMSWSLAKQYCVNLDTDAGGWHLPIIGELRTLIRGCPATETGGSCNVEESDCMAWSCRDGSCNGCSGNQGPANGCYWPDEMQGTCGWYWSSSAVEDSGGYAWNVYFDSGYVNGNAVLYDVHVRCVRDAP